MKIIIPLSKAGGTNTILCGNKAASLSKIIDADITVPPGICLTRNAYDWFIHEMGIDKLIIMELSRKKFEDMRWEELWDASLRIRNWFTKAKMPKKLKNEIITNVRNVFHGKPLAIRSSSLNEDSPDASFAGIHESYVNISTEYNIIQSIKLVWASLWSDAALLYRDELSLSTEKSAMGVIIQEMIPGDVSGIAFCESPYNKEEAIIESIFGLNKGLVDGDIEPDRFIIDRNNKSIKSVTNAQHIRKVSPAKDGVKFVDLSNKINRTLNNQQVNQIYHLMESLENIFKYPQDIEWTIKGKDIYVLQSRPITIKDKDEKQWNLTLKRSFDNLEKLAHRVQKEILPQMEDDAEKLGHTDIVSLTDNQLIKEIEKRKELYDKWNETYWNECIPFAHGVRLFATVYNDKIQPEDPYEFIDIILPNKMKSTERNALIEDAALYLKNNPDSIDKDGNIKDNTLQKKVSLIADEIGFTVKGTNKTVSNDILNIIRESSRMQISKIRNNKSVDEKTKTFISSFPEDERDYAKKLIWLARTSYQLRDDDNIYLGKLSTNLSFAIKEANQRIGFRLNNMNACTNAEEAIKALKFPDYIPPENTQKETNESNITLNIRQLRGQPAGKGIARGKARVIKTNEDLYKMKKDEILVCDAIDPNMTFIIPIASAIVERRGGMLIHGAIIAREYGIACVTGIPQATEVIRNGDDITVDGYYGLVINHSRTLE